MHTSKNDEKNRRLMRVYERSESVVFHRTKEQHGQLSNMAGGFPLTVNSLHVASSEALYQACRFPHLPDVQRRIIGQNNALFAKRIGRPYKDDTRPDWISVRARVMRWCLRVKLAQHRDTFGHVLIKTGDSPIVEQSSKDAYWGAIPREDGKLKGHNVLGRLLMELRQEVQECGIDKFDTVAPAEISNFLLLGEPIALVRATDQVTPQHAFRV